MVYHSAFVGINYAGTSNRLSGCLNDAGDWHELFTPFSATSDQLLERAAARNGLIPYLEKLMAALAPGDTAILEYSGHGTQLRDRGGDESDRYDEAICPYDLQEVITDDELYAIFSQRVPGSRVIFIADCCHSGTITRKLAAPRRLTWNEVTEGMGDDEADLSAAIARERAVLTPRGGASDKDVVLLSGCKDDEVSYDATFNGRANGAFSYYAIKAHKQLWPGATLNDWYAKLTTLIRASGYKQTPQLIAEGGAGSWVVPGWDIATVPPPAPAVSVWDNVAVSLNGETRRVKDWY